MTIHTGGLEEFVKKQFKGTDSYLWPCKRQHLFFWPIFLHSTPFPGQTAIWTGLTLAGRHKIRSIIKMGLVVFGINADTVISSCSYKGILNIPERRLWRRKRSKKIAAEFIDKFPKIHIFAGQSTEDNTIKVMKRELGEQLNFFSLVTVCLCNFFTSVIYLINTYFLWKWWAFYWAALLW